MATDALFAEMEKVGKQLPEFVNNWAVARNLIKKQGSVEMVSERDFRAPFLTQLGGRKGTFNANGGAYGRGTAQKGGVMIQTAFNLRVNFELTQLQIDATDSAEKSRLNAFRKAMSDAPKVCAVFLDEMFHGDGTATLGTAIAQTTVSGKTRYQMDTVTGLNKLHVGDYVIPYDSGGNALNSGTAVYIEQLDYENRYVFLSALIASAAATDTLQMDGSSGTSPTGPNGIKYFITDSTSGSTLGVSRATTYEIVSNSVDVSGIPTVMKGQNLIDKIITRRGGELAPDMKWLANVQQKSNLYANVQNVSRIDSFDGDLNKDLNTKAKALQFKFCGCPGFVDPRQDTDRMDLLIPSDWGRVQIKDLGYVEVGGQKVFQLYDPTTGSPAASQWFGFYILENYVCRNPGQSGYLKNLSLAPY